MSLEDIIPLDDRGISQADTVEDLIDNFAGYCYTVGKRFENGVTGSPANEIDVGKELFFSRLEEICNREET